MKILFVTNDGGRGLAGRSVSWLGLEVRYASFTFEDLVQFRYAPDREPIFDRRALDRALEELDEHDGVFAEEPETLLLGYVRKKRGCRPLLWCVNVVQAFRRAEVIRRDIREQYGDDPLALLAGDDRFLWGYTTRSHRERLVEVGLPDRRLVLCPTSSAMHTALFPGSAEAFEAAGSSALPEHLRALEGAVLLAGTNNRDLKTTARAAQSLDRPVHVLTDLQRTGRLQSPDLVYHGAVPLNDFIAAVAHASVLLVPLHLREDSCGQQSIATAQRVGTVVVASDVPAVEGYVVHEQSGFLAKPGDAADLVLQVQTALAHGDDAGLLAAARARDAADSEQFERLFRRAFLGEVPERAGLPPL